MVTFRVNPRVVALLFAFAATTVMAQPRNEPRPAPPPQPADAPQEVPGDRPQRRPPAPPRPDGIEPDTTGVRCELTVFEVTLPADAILEMNRDRLLRAGATAQNVAATLRELGKTTVLYRLDQVVCLERDARLQVTTDIPYVGGMTTSAGGGSTAMVARQDAGLKVGLRGRWMEGGHQRAAISIDCELSAMGASTVDTGGGVKAPVFRRVRQQFEGQHELAAPIVMVSADVSEDPTRATALITLVHLTAQAPHAARVSAAR